MTAVERPTRTPHAALMWGLASAPVVWLLLFALFVVRARLALGKWPAPYRPDPKDLGFDLHHAAILVGMPAMFGAVLCVTTLTLVGPRWPGTWPVRLAALGGLVVVIMLAQADPGYLFTWLGD